VIPNPLSPIPNVVAGGEGPSGWASQLRVVGHGEGRARLLKERRILYMKQPITYARGEIKFNKKFTTGNLD
jgi:hypothetical protein